MSQFTVKYNDSFCVQVVPAWCNKGCGMCYPVCGMVHIKKLIRVAYVAAADFLSHYQNGP